MKEFPTLTQTVKTSNDIGSIKVGYTFMIEVTDIKLVVS